MRKNLLPTEMYIPIDEVRGVTPTQLMQSILRRFPRIGGIFKDPSDIPNGFPQRVYVEASDVMARFSLLIENALVWEFIHSRSDGRYNLPPTQSRYFTCHNVPNGWGAREHKLFDISYNLYLLNNQFRNGELRLPNPSAENQSQCTSADRSDIPNDAEATTSVLNDVAELPLLRDAGIDPIVTEGGPRSSAHIVAIDFSTATSLPSPMSGSVWQSALEQMQLDEERRRFRQYWNRELNNRTFGGTSDNVPPLERV